MHENVAVSKEEDDEGEVERLRRNEEVHSMSRNEASWEKITHWVKVQEFLKRRAKKSKNPNARNMLMARVN